MKGAQHKKKFQTNELLLWRVNNLHKNDRFDLFEWYVIPKLLENQFLIKTFAKIALIWYNKCFWYDTLIAAKIIIHRGIISY